MWRTNDIALDEWIDEEVQLTMCLMKDPALIKQYFGHFRFPEVEKFKITDDEATQESKLNYGNDMMNAEFKQAPDVIESPSF